MEGSPRFAQVRAPLLRLSREGWRELSEESGDGQRPSALSVLVGAGAGFAHPPCELWPSEVVPGRAGVVRCAWCHWAQPDVPTGRPGWLAHGHPVWSLSLASAPAVHLALGLTLTSGPRPLWPSCWPSPRVPAPWTVHIPLSVSHHVRATVSASHRVRAAMSMLLGSQPCGLSIPLGSVTAPQCGKH